MTRRRAWPEDGIGNEFGRAPDVPNLFVSNGSVMNTEAAANVALTVVAPGRPHRGPAQSGVVSRRSTPVPADCLLVPD
jgi:hypothetical protein